MSAPTADTTKRPSIGQSILFGLGLSLGGAALLAAVAPFAGYGTALRGVIALLGLAYVLYLVGKSGERVGRMTTIVAWLAAAVVVWLAGLPLVAYVLVHVGLVWLARSLYYYSGVLPALADLGLTLLGCAFAVWAAQRSGAAWLALWCFFLAQALFVLIPQSLAGRASEPADAADLSFNRAHRAAEAAVRRLSSAR
jgi:hypothetical protein